MAAPIARCPLPRLCRRLCFSRRAELRLNSTEALRERQAPGSEPDVETGTRKKTFSEVLAERQEQAQRTVLINCPSKISEKKLLKYLSSHGNIRNHFFYETHGVYAVIEFSGLDSIASLQEATGTPQFEDDCPIPFKSRILTLTLKNPPSQASEKIHFHKQTTVPVGELMNALCNSDSNWEERFYLPEGNATLTMENIFVETSSYAEPLMQDICES